MATETKKKSATKAVPIRWDDLTAAFENNAPDVHSYLNLDTGHVLRIVDGTPGSDDALTRVATDPEWLVVDPVSSRDQYRWMERFIATVDDPELRDRLTAAIDGKGAFRRFKDVLLSFPDERERWFQFRSDLLKVEIDAWLKSHDLEAVAPPEPKPLPAEDGVESPPEPPPKPRGAGAETLRKRLHELADAVPARDLAAALAFLEYLRDRRPPRPRVRRTTEESPKAEGESQPTEPTETEPEPADGEEART